MQISAEINHRDYLAASVLQVLQEIENVLEIPVFESMSSSPAAAAASSSHGAAGGSHYHHHYGGNGNSNNSNRHGDAGRSTTTQHHNGGPKRPMEIVRSASTVQSGGRSGGGPAGPSSFRRLAPSSEAAAGQPQWETVRSFKSTKVGAGKTGIDKWTNDLRVALNKLSATNFTKQRDVILGMVTRYFEGPAEGDADPVVVSDANTQRIAKIIFDIASSNKFYSEIYVLLYKDLVEVNGVFRALIDDFVAEFSVMDDFPVYADPDTDYDGFCAYTKACEAKQSASTFLVNCVKQSLLSPSHVLGIVREFIGFIEAHLAVAEKVKIIEELVENMYILLTACATELRVHDAAQWNDVIMQGIRGIVAERGQPGLSNRSVFKCMDILDKLSAASP